MRVVQRTVEGLSFGPNIAIQDHEIQSQWKAMLQFKPQKKLNKKLVLGRGAGGYPDRMGSEKILVCTYQMIIKILIHF